MNGIRMVLLGLNGKEDEASRAMREKAILKLQDLQEEIRSISHELSDTAYEKFHNFILSMEELIVGRCEPAGLVHHLEYDKSAEWDVLPGLVKVNLHRIVEESLQNVIKHAEATEVWVELDATDGHWEVRIRDNGKGFRKGRSRKGIGQKNIESRVQKMNGTWEIQSGSGRGTEILVRVPKTTDYVSIPTSETEAELLN
jgi:signal transduction histidine kinase